MAAPVDAVVAQPSEETSAAHDAGSAEEGAADVNEAHPYTKFLAEKAEREKEEEALPDDEVLTELHEAVNRKNAEDVTAILTKAKSSGDELNIDGTDSQEATILHRAARNGDAATVQVLIDAGAAVGAVDKFGKTPLVRAGHAGSVEAIRALLGAGADVSHKDKEGKSALHRAAARGHIEACTALIAGGADCKATTLSGQTLLHLAAANGSSAVPFILDKDWGKELVSVNDDNSDQPLHHAATKGSEETIDQLLKAGAAVDAPNSTGATPLHFAAAQGQTGAVSKLLAAGADKSLKTTDGQTPAMLAKKYSQPSTIRLLNGAKGPGCVVC